MPFPYTFEFEFDEHFPEVTARMAFGDDWNAASPTWSNVHSVMYGWEVERGRQFELDRIEAGSASAKLNNRSGDFWPDNTGGAYSPNVDAGVRMNIRVRYGLVTYDLYTGYVESWLPEPQDAMGQPIVTVQAYDGLAEFGARVVNVNPEYAQELSGTRLANVLDDVGWMAAARNLAAGVGTIIASGVLTNVNARTHINEVLRAERGYLFVAGNGDMTFHDLHSRLKSPLTTSQLTLGDDPGELPYFKPIFELTKQSVLNDVRLTRSGGTEQTSSDAVSDLKYGTRSLVESGILLLTDGVIQDQADYLVSRFKDATMRLRGVRIFPAAKPLSLFPQVLGREIGDRITVRYDPASLDEEFNIEGIVHRTRAQGKWETDWWLSAADTQAYWAMGVPGFSNIGQSTRTAP